LEKKIFCVGGGFTSSIEGFDQSGYLIGGRRPVGVVTGGGRFFYGEVNFLSSFESIRFDIEFASLPSSGFQWYMEMSGSIEG
jgi:hypothetical protein